MAERGTDRIGRMFGEARSRGRAVLLPYLTAGLPDAAASVDLFAAMAEAGADGFEVGIPYADPLMDGPVIQEAASRALRGGVSLDRAFGVVARVVERTGKPVFVMTYVNPVLRRGIDVFARRVADAGAVGVIVADLPADEARPFRAAADAAGIGMVLFAAPTTTDERLRRVVAADPAFIYGIAELGVTGERAAGSSRAAALSARVRALTSIPLVLGVGISTPAQAAAAARLGDGVIVGSALVRRVLEAGGAREAAEALAAAVTDLSRAMERG